MPAEKGFTVQLTSRLAGRILPNFPLPNYDAALLMEPHFRCEWVDFLFHYRRRSQFLFDFMAYGPDFAEHVERPHIERQIAKIFTWIDAAKEEFKAGPTSFFWKCRILDHRDRPKHWRPPGFSKAKIMAQSRANKEGIFMPGMSVKFLVQGLWSLFAVHFAQARTRRLRLPAFDWGIDIGYAEGISTSIVRYDIDYPRIHAHCYPILPRETRGHPLTTLAELNMEIRYIAPN